MDAPVVKIGGSLRVALRRFSDDRLGWMNRAAALGPVAGLRLGPVTAWVVTDPLLARDMLITNGSAWVRPPAIVNPVRIGVGENLFTQRERAWKRAQPVLAPAFRAKALEPRLRSLVDILAEEVAALPTDVEIDLSVVVHRLVMIAAAWVLFGDHLARDRADELAAHQRAIVEWVGHRLGRISGAFPVATPRTLRPIRQHRAALDHYATDLARDASRTSDHDVLRVLADAPSRNGQMLGLLLAGSETTASALTWALVHAHRNPSEWERLRADSSRARIYVSETLRMTPPSWGIPRTPRRSTTLHAGSTQVRVRRGAVVNVYLRAINRDASVWAEPDRFRPDRHTTAAAQQAQSFLPFGLGPRSCIGQHLALAELEQVLPILAARGDIEISSSTIEDPHFALRTRDPLRGRIRPRP